MLQTFESLCKIFNAEHVRYPDLVFAESRSTVESGGRSHHHGSAFVFEVRKAPAAEILRILDRQAGKRIERSLRHRAVNARNLVESVDDEITAGLIFVEASLRILLRTIDGGLGHDLSEKRRAKTALGHFHGTFYDFFIMGDNHSDPDSALGIALGHGIHENHVLLYPFEGHGRLIRNSGIAEFAISLVRDEEKVMFLDNVAYAQEFLVRIQVAGRIVRVAEENEFRLFRHRLQRPEEARIRSRYMSARS